MFAQAILEQARHAHVILTGRDAPSGERGPVRALDALARDASTTGRSTWRTAVAEARSRRFAEGALHGILHSAGMIVGQLHPEQDRAEFRAVLQPKSMRPTSGRRQRGAGLDFFVLFSSIAVAFGNVGQADYAAANGFLDEFAQCRSRRVTAGERRGRTVVDRLALWAVGGMQLIRALQVERMRERRECSR